MPWKSSVVHTYSSSQFALGMFQMLISHICLLATILERARAPGTSVTCFQWSKYLLILVSSQTTTTCILQEYLSYHFAKVLLILNPFRLNYIKRLDYIVVTNDDFVSSLWIMCLWANYLIQGHLDSIKLQRYYLIISYACPYTICSLNLIWIWLFRF